MKRDISPDIAQALQPGADAAAPHDPRALYQSLQLHGLTPRNAVASREFLADQLAQAESCACDLPASAHELEDWMHAGTAGVAQRYADYLARRRGGAPRSFFTNRAHALYFLRSVAPTKLVDGAWLYGMARQWKNPRYSNLARTYLEELGNGDRTKNHVLLYRRLLEANGLEQWQDLPSSHFQQGALQLALGYHSDDFVPEVVGFNLGYEQLPLHLLITSYELDELGIDPYYFTLHVTVDNAGTGHARRAVQAVFDTLPELGDAGAFWQRVRNGYKLNELGLGTTQVIGLFDAEREAVEVFKRKSVSGQGAHSDYCKVAGRTVNDWLSDPEHVPYFLDALKRAGWITPGSEPATNRFWQLLIGDRAKMFGVFSGYELQVIHDWIRGAASADGRPYDWAPPEGSGASYRPRTHRAAEKLADARAAQATHVPPQALAPIVVDEELQCLESAVKDQGGSSSVLVDAISPRTHWQPAGLQATRMLMREAFGQA